MQRTWSYHHHHLIILFKDQERAEVCLLKGQWWKPLVIVCPDLSHREKDNTCVCMAVPHRRGSGNQYGGIFEIVGGRTITRSFFCKHCESMMSWRYHAWLVNWLPAVQICLILIMSEAGWESDSSDYGLLCPLNSKTASVSFLVTGF